MSKCDCKVFQLYQGAVPAGACTNCAEFVAVLTAVGDVYVVKSGIQHLEEGLHYTLQHVTLRLSEIPGPAAAQVVAELKEHTWLLFARGFEAMAHLVHAHRVDHLPSQVVAAMKARDWVTDTAGRRGLDALIARDTFPALRNASNGRPLYELLGAAVAAPHFTIVDELYAEMRDNG